MKKYIIANFKSNKNLQEAEDWLEKMLSFNSFLNKDLEVIVCPPFIYLYKFKNIIDSHKLFLSLGSQDISEFPDGAYTGEITSRMLSGLCQYAIIGHSERRSYFKETGENIRKKVTMAMESNIKPIVGVSDIEQAKALQEFNGKLPSIIFAYEPVKSIGSGQPEGIGNAKVNISKIKEIFPNCKAIYGGSVNKDNISSYIKDDICDGVILGKACLDPDIFKELIQNALKN